MDDPFAMMAGMGEEEVYKVTLLEDQAQAPAQEAKVEDPAAREVQAVAEAAVQGEKAVVEEEEEAAGDMDDPFAMMAGMGEEEVYKVTLLEDQAQAPAQEAQVEEPASREMKSVAAEAAIQGEKAAVEEEEEKAAGDMDDPFAMMAGMG